MDQVLLKDQAHANKLRHSRREGLASSIDRRALMNAVKSEGSVILTEAGAEYWKDQERKYPHLNISGRDTQSGQSNGASSHFGKVSRRFSVARGWERRVNGNWVKETPEQTKSKRKAW